MRMNMEKLSVCYASSDEFAIHTGISLFSLLENNDGIIDEVYILDYGILGENKARLRDMCTQHHAGCTFIFSKDKLIELGEKTGIKNFRNSYATYSRAFLDKLLPNSVDKLLYIDSDTVVIGSIAPLMDIDMSEKVIAGCANSTFYGIRKDGKDRKKELNLLSGNKLYLHCGVLLYSLENWRKMKCTETIMEVAPKLKEMPYADQTVINNALSDSMFQIFPLNYDASLHNYCDEFNLMQYRGGNWYSDEEIYDALKHPVIIHYCGGALQRPWFTECQSRLKSHYYKYKMMTPWRDVPLNESNLFTNQPDKKKKLKNTLLKWAMNSNSLLIARMLSKASYYI